MTIPEANSALTLITPRSENLCTAVAVTLVQRGFLPRHAHHNAAIPEGAAFVHIHSNAGMADVTIIPGRVGTARATIQLWNEDFQPLAAEKLTFSLRAPGIGSELITRSPAPDQDGSWIIDGLELPQAGDWTVTIDATLADNRRLLLDAPIVIEPER